MPSPRRTDTSSRTYWRQNLRLVAVLLLIWFTVSFGFGILLVDLLDRIRIAGFPLGFWFAQQGSIYVFVALIFFYAWRMNAIDRAHGVDERDEPDEPSDDGPGGGASGVGSRRSAGVDGRRASGRDGGRDEDPT